MVRHTLAGTSAQVGCAHILWPASFPVQTSVTVHRSSPEEGMVGLAEALCVRKEVKVGDKGEDMPQMQRGVL